MKNPFFKKIAKSLIVAGMAISVCNCGDDATSDEMEPTAEKANSTVYIVSEPSYLYSDGNANYLISIDGIVKDTLGNKVGLADIANGVIMADDQTVIAVGVDFNTLLPVMPTVVKSTAWILNADKVYVIYTDGTVTDASGVQVGTIQFIEGTFIGDITGLDGAPIVNGVDVSTLQLATANVSDTPDDKNQNGSSPDNGSNISSSNSNGNGGNENISSATPTAKSSSSEARSSSSQAKSSSSQAKSSSSQGSTGSSYTIKYIQGGKSGSGYATRYWDCCEPHCAWPEHGGKASTCDAKGNKVAGGSQSMCDGGNAGICRNQFPIVVSETMAFAFAATPGGENNCGKCFDLAFTGKGKYATDNHTKLKGKHLIVMSSNVGYDVAGGQFDVMIPGGGFGIFDGCSQRMGWGSQGSQYGGLLDECEKETGYTATKYKSCLTEKCNKSFSMDPEAKEGCLFLANWMNASGNPLLEYKEVECPQELIDRF